VFNLIPVPPLDGSHVLRHFLSGSALMVYDRLGFFGLFILVYFAPGLLDRLFTPVLAFFLYFLR
jgi:Zn-dependent protease